MNIITISGLTLLSGCAGMFADSLVYANRQPIIKNPKDYGMEFFVNNFMDDTWNREEYD